MRLTDAQIAETRAAAAKWQHPDGRPNAEQIAKALNLSASTVKNRLYRIKTVHSSNGLRDNGLDEKTSQNRQNDSRHERPAYSEPSKPRIRVPYRTQPVAQEEEALRVCVIGDLHVSPGQDLSRLKWIARHIGETRPDHIVQIGDWSDFDSVSTHDPLGSITNKHKPSLRQDLDAHHESLHVFDKELGPSTIPRLVTLGNHCDRVRRYEELRCELEGSVWTEVLQSFAQFRWKTYGFGDVVFIEQTGFVHVPMNRMGKAHASPNIIGNSLSHDLVYGHTHLGGWWPFPKVGENAGITLINVATSYIHGRIKEYAKLSQTGWRWGLTELTLRGGRIDDFAFTSMRSLEAKYG